MITDYSVCCNVCPHSTAIDQLSNPTLRCMRVYNSTTVTFMPMEFSHPPVDILYTFKSFFVWQHQASVAFSM